MSFVRHSIIDIHSYEHICNFSSYAGDTIRRYAIFVECWNLIKRGILNVEDVDKVMSEGLGMRYAFLGPMETAHLNAEGKIVSTISLITSILPSYSAMCTQLEAWVLKQILSEG